MPTAPRIPRTRESVHGNRQTRHKVLPCAPARRDRALDEVTKGSVGVNFWVPSRLMLAALLVCVTASALTLWMALDQPRLGLVLRPDTERDSVRIERVDPRGPARDLTAPADLVALAGADGRRLTLRPDDVVEESDYFDSYDRIAAFQVRQSALNDILHQPELTLEARAPDGTAATVTVSPAPRLPVHLPPPFWVQLFVGAGAFLISAWVWALRREDWGARMLVAAGLAIMLSSFSAAIYSTRELAMDGDLHRVLSALNHLGSLGFGCAMIALFLLYPRQLVRPALLWPLPVIVATWLAADISRLAPDPATGSQLPTLIEMLLIVICIGLQWRATRGDPRGRAALRWLGLAVIIGAGAFVATIITPVLIGGLPPLSQGYAFLFFLLIHAGVALGVSRYRLFELDEWAFRILYYTGALLLLLALDAALIFALHLEPGPSFGLALLAVAFGYLPLRDGLWRWAVARRKLGEDELFRSIVDVAFAATEQERAARWRGLLTRLFDPLEMLPAPEPVATVDVRQEGLELALPAMADAPALILRCPWGGRGLFGPSHLALARQLTTLMARIEQGRDAYDRGASEERRRIAADLHDDVGARLLTSLHRDGLDDTRETLRDVLTDIRAIASGLTGDRKPLAAVAADLRHETGQRLDGAGLDMEWRASGIEDGVLLDYPVYRNLIASHREMLSNAIRHARASRVSVELSRANGMLSLVVEDDGIGLDPDARRGNGLANLSRRIAGLGGEIAFPSCDSGTRIMLSLPLEQSA